ATGQELMALPCSAGLQHAVLSPDGRQLAGAAGDATVRIWDSRPMSPELDVQREARSIVGFFFGQGFSEADVRRRTASDMTITEPVRMEALALAGAYGRSFVECQAHRLVQELFAKPSFREDVLER